MLKDFVKTVTEGEGASRKALQKLAEDVQEFAMRFPLPGVIVRCISLFSKKSVFTDESILEELGLSKYQED